MKKIIIRNLDNIPFEEIGKYLDFYKKIVKKEQDNINYWSFYSNDKLVDCYINTIKDTIEFIFFYE